MHQRVIGCLYGQAIGDSVGTVCEFDNHQTAQRKVAKFKNRLPIHQITDDTEMALAMTRSLVRRQTYDPFDVIDSYVKWFQTDPFDVGSTTHHALQLWSNTVSVIDGVASISLKETLQRVGQSSLSNGSLMRSSPLGIVGSQWNLHDLETVGTFDCQITHGHRIAQEATRIYLRALRTAILTGDQSSVVQESLQTVTSPHLREVIMRGIKSSVVTTFPVIGVKKEVAIDSCYQGSLEITLGLAFYELIHAHDFEDLLKDISARGGDADTNCAVAGALYGAVHGYTTIPTYLLHERTFRRYPRERVYPWGSTKDLDRLALQLLHVDPPRINFLSIM